MFGIGSTELVIIIIVALIVVGPSKLPQLMRSVGKGLAELRSVGSDVKQTLEREVERAEQDNRRKEAKQELDRKAEKDAEEEKSPAPVVEAEVEAEPKADSGAETAVETEVLPAEDAHDAPATPEGDPVAATADAGDGQAKGRSA